MLQQYGMILLFSATLVFQGCSTTGPNPVSKSATAGAGQLALEKARRQADDRRYAPYTIINTIEGYRRFTERYPDNLNVPAAKKNISRLAFEQYERKDSPDGVRAFLATYPDCLIAQRRLEYLEYAPYEKLNSIPGYERFIREHPGNHNIGTARRKLADLAFEAAERADTPEAYRTYLARHPQSNFECEARERLHELVFRRLDGQLREKNGFDLLLYRLWLKRHRKSLAETGNPEMGAFISDAALQSIEGKKYFHTRFLYPDRSTPDHLAAGEADDAFFDAVLAHALRYLDTKFTRKQTIQGFSFSVAAAPFGFCKAAPPTRIYRFRTDQVLRFTRGKADLKEILSTAQIQAH